MYYFPRRDSNQVILATERPKTHDFDRTATGIYEILFYFRQNINFPHNLSICLTVNPIIHELEK
jgi:hypothetical protein